MEINIGARVVCKDGEAGTVRYVVVDRDSRTASEIVVDMAKLYTFDVVVPVSLIRGSSRDAVYLDCTIDELKRQPEYDVEEYQQPTEEERACGPTPGVPWHGIRFRAPAVPVRGQERHRLQPGEVPIREGMLVRCADGPCGNVDEVLTDPQSGQVTAFVIRKGRLFQRDVVVPTDRIRQITSGEIDLDVSIKDLDRLSQESRPAA